MSAINRRFETTGDLPQGPNHHQKTNKYIALARPHVQGAGTASAPPTPQPIRGPIDTDWHPGFPDRRGQIGPRCGKRVRTQSATLTGGHHRSAPNTFDMRALRISILVSPSQRPAPCVDSFLPCPSSCFILFFFCRSAPSLTCTHVLKAIDVAENIRSTYFFFERKKGLHPTSKYSLCLILSACFAAPPSLSSPYLELLCHVTSMTHHRSNSITEAWLAPRTSNIWGATPK